MPSIQSLVAFGDDHRAKEPDRPVSLSRPRRDGEIPVLCPYTRLHRRTEESLDRFAPWAAKHKLEGDGTAGNVFTDYHYGRLLADWWARGEAFVLIEHDIVLHETVIPEFTACPHPWCCFPYSTAEGGRLFDALGCVRYGQEVMDATRRDAPYLGIVPWYGLDQAIHQILFSAGFRPHHHWPMVGHQHNQIEGDDSDGRDEREYRRKPLPARASIRQTPIDHLAAVRTHMGGMLYLGLNEPAQPGVDVLADMGEPCPDCGGDASHENSCRRLGTPYQFRDRARNWTTFVEDDTFETRAVAADMSVDSYKNMWARQMGMVF